MTIERFADDVWVMPRLQKFWGVETGTRATIAKLRDGSLFVHCPVASANQASTHTCFSPSPPDAGSPSDAGDPGPVVPAQGGCSCDVGAPDLGAPSLGALAIGALAIARRKRCRQ